MSQSMRSQMTRTINHCQPSFASEVYKCRHVKRKCPTKYAVNNGPSSSLAPDRGNTTTEANLNRTLCASWSYFQQIRWANTRMTHLPYLL